MPIRRFSPDHLYVTTHELKNHLAKLLRLLKTGRYKGAVVTRRGREVALLLSLEAPRTPDSLRSKK